MIELSKDTFVDTIWFVGGPTGDWMCFLYRPSPADSWKLTYRFRYRKDDLFTADSKDTKNWYSMNLGAEPSNDQLELARAAARTVASVGMLHYGSHSFDELDVKGDGYAAATAIGSKSWGHLQSTSGQLPGQA